MAGSTRPSHLSITAEPAGGSVCPTGPDHRHGDCLTTATQLLGSHLMPEEDATEEAPTH